MKFTLKSAVESAQKGSILIAAILICAMGTIGITAWISVITTRSQQVEQIGASVIRRLRAENGRVAAREYFYRNVVTKSSGSAYSESLPDGWGGFSVEAWTGAPMDSTAQGVYNHFSPVPYFTYSKEFTVSISDGVSNLGHTFRVRSRNPMLGGDLFSMHTPTLSPGATNTLSGNINVHGRALIWTGEPGSNLAGLDADRYVSRNVANPTLVLNDTSGSANLPDNYPMTPMTNAEFGGVTYGGELNVVDGGIGNEENSLAVKMGTPVVVDGSVELAWTNGVSSNGTGRVYIDLDDPNLGPVLVQDVYRIYLYGQTTAAEAAGAAVLDPVAILLVRSNLAQRDLFSLRMFDGNSRRLHIGVKKTVGGAEVWGFVYDADLNPTWRMMLTLENSSLRLINLYQGSVTIEGGIRTDRSIRHTGWSGGAGSIEITQETDPGNLETLETRNAWLEGYWE
ncbi:MAG: hypothetical protein ACC661_00435 [Verrucomicrobiales bacterium]